MRSSQTKRAHLALYGSIVMHRGYCKSCRGNALIIDNKLACCDAPFSEAPEALKRMSASDGIRKAPSKDRQDAILAAQDGKCLYCEFDFDRVVLRGRKAHRLRVEWDHLIPFAYSQSCADQEFVAACQVCNRLKSARIFQTLDEAKVFLALRREEKGWPF